MEMLLKLYQVGKLMFSVYGKLNFESKKYISVDLPYQRFFISNIYVLMYETIKTFINS